MLKITSKNTSFDEKKLPEIGKLYKIKNIDSFSLIFYSDRKCSEFTTIQLDKNASIIILILEKLYIEHRGTFYKFLYKDKILYTSYGYISEISKYARCITILS